MVSVYIRSPRYAEVIFDRIYTLAAFKGLRKEHVNRFAPGTPKNKECKSVIAGMGANVTK